MPEKIKKLKNLHHLKNEGRTPGPDEIDPKLIENGTNYLRLTEP